MTASNDLRILFGTASVAQWPADDRTKIFELLKKHGVKDLDTANIYVESEKTLSGLDLFQEFIFHTKAPGFKDGVMTKNNVIAAGTESKELLREIETYFLHSPDPKTPIAETLAGIQALYEKKTFKCFGLSNFTPEQTQEVYDICKSNNYVLPTVYQGSYNAVSRRQEGTLFPLLRKLGIRFYAYSPIGGGFLAKDVGTFTGNSGTGRFELGKNPVAPMYNKLYNRPKLLEGLKLWGEIAQEEGIPSAALAYRWATYHSALRPDLGDGLIFGGRSSGHVEETLTWIEDGPLSDKAVARIQDMWEGVKAEAPLDNYNTEA